MFTIIKEYFSKNLLVISFVTLLLCSTGAYFYGRHDGAAIKQNEVTQLELKWEKEKLSELEKKVKTEKALEENRQEAEVKWKTKVVPMYIERDTNYETAQNNLPNQYIISNGSVYAINSAMQGVRADAARVADATPSGITNSEADSTHVWNYGTCRIFRQQLIELQDYLTYQKKLSEEINKE